MPFGYEYYGNIDETINCTAAMNPNNTVNVPDWKKVSVTEWIFLRKDKKCTNNRGIKKQHRLLSDRTNCFYELGNFLADYNWVGCQANDLVSGQNPISEFKTVSVLIIHWVMWPINLNESDVKLFRPRGIFKASLELHYLIYFN